MEPQILKIFGQVAGIAGLVLGVFLLIFRDVIRKGAFSKLTTADSYKLFRLILSLTFALALLGLGSWFYSSVVRKPAHLIYRGSIRDIVTRLPLKDAEISFLGRPDIATQKTDDKGNFSFTIEGSAGSFSGKVQALRCDYEAWERQLDLSSSSVTEEILLQPVADHAKGKNCANPAYLRGVVFDRFEKLIDGAEVNIEQATPRESVKTASDGGFQIDNISSRLGESVRITVSKAGYKVFTGYVTLPGPVRVKLEKLR